MNIPKNTDFPSSIREVNPNMERLHFYTRTKLALAGQLRILREALSALGREQGERQCAELIVKLAEDRFTLAVLGQFKRGKSSLVNAIIGRDLLPTGVLPLTSAITVLKYGPAAKLIIHRKNSIFPEELSLSALPDYVTERGNPSNQKKVKTAYIELPLPFLRCGLEFVDTPGVGSAVTSNTATTYGFLPESDAVLFVTSADAPLTSLELNFLTEIKDYVNKIFFIVNKTDLVTDQERSEILQFVTQTIQGHTGNEQVKIFPVSSRLGIAAKMSGSPALYEQSGLKALEETLSAFLSGEKSVAFLAAIAYKTLQVFAAEAAQGAFEETAIQTRIQALQSDPLTYQRDSHSAANVAIATQLKIKTMYESILHSPTPFVTSNVENFAASSKNPPAPSITDYKSTPSTPDIMTDLKTRGCPVCHHITKQAADFFAQWQYYLGTEEQAQKEFAAEIGFCPLHSWQLISMSSPHGASIGYSPLADQVAQRLRKIAVSAQKTDSVRQLICASQSCRVCDLLRRSETEYIRQLATLIMKADGFVQYRQSQGVCLRHLALLLGASTAEFHEFLISHSAQRFAEDAEDMRSFVLKQEALRRALQNRNETDAYRRTMIRIIGNRNVCLPWPGDGDI
jgi:GTP-binding protein EngB required for normal cell division